MRLHLEYSGPDVKLAFHSVCLTCIHQQTTHSHTHMHIQTHNGFSLNMKMEVQLKTMSTNMPFWPNPAALAAGVCWATSPPRWIWTFSLSLKWHHRSPAWLMSPHLDTLFYPECQLNIWKVRTFPKSLGTGLGLFDWQSVCYSTFPTVPISGTLVNKPTSNLSSVVSKQAN